MDWDSLATKYVVPMLGSVGTITVAVGFFWTNLRQHARRLEIIDLATKRTTFWNQFITAVNLATAADSPERKSEQDKTYKAVLRIHSDALLQTQALVRNKKIGRGTDWRAFKYERTKLNKWYLVVLWWYLVLLSGATLLMALALFVQAQRQVLAGRTANNPHWLLSAGTSIVFIVMGRYFLVLAQGLKHDAPEPPIIDVI